MIFKGYVVISSVQRYHSMFEMKFFVLSPLLLAVFICHCRVSANINELKLEKRSTCAITLNPNLTRDQLLDVLVKCFEGNPEALAKIPPLASKHKCVGTLRQIILCIIRNRGNLDANDWNVLLDILKLVTQCTRVIVSNVGNLTGIPYLQELLHCLGDFFGI